MPRNTFVALAFVGLVVGSILGMPRISEILVFLGFWAGVIWVIWVPALIVLLMRPRQPLRTLYVSVAFALVSFTLTYLTIGMSPDEGSPITATVIGGWMTFWITTLATATLIRTGALKVTDGNGAA